MLYSDVVVAYFDVGGASTNPQNDLRRYLERAFVDYLYSGRFTYSDWLSIGLKSLVRNIFALLFGSKLLLMALRLRKRRLP